MNVRGFVTAHGRTVKHGHLGGFPPAVALEAERQMADDLVGAAAKLLLDGAHDVSDSGLDPLEALSSASAARAVVAVRAGAETQVHELCEATGVPYTAICTTGANALHVGDLPDVRLEELRAVREATLPVAFER